MHESAAAAVRAQDAHASSLPQPAAALAPAGSSRRAVERALLLGAPAAYLVALAVVSASRGLPLTRDQMFIWLLLGMAAFSVAAWRSWGGMLLEWLPFFGLLVAYDFLRGAVAVAPERAHVVAQLAVDRALAGGAVPTVWLQQQLWSPGRFEPWDYGIWVVYMTHFLVVWVVAAVIWCVARERFRRYAALTVVLTLAAFLVYWCYPAQPPWLTANGPELPPVDRIVPAVWDHIGVTKAHSLYANDNLVNPVAAMPSLHAAYPFMLMLFFWPAGRLVRIGLALYTLAMGFALVYSGEHYVTDILAGWLMAAAAYALVGAAASLASRGLRGLSARRGAGAPAAPP